MSSSNQWEILFFRMFDLRNMPFVSGRRVSWSNELYPVAAPSLRQSIQKKSGKILFHIVYISSLYTSSTAQYLYEIFLAHLSR